MIAIPAVHPIALDFAEYRDLAHEGDALLWEPEDPIGDAIAWATFGDFSHVSMTVLIHQRLWSAAYREHLNGYATPLSGEVRRNPRRIAVFRPKGLTQDQSRNVAYTMLRSLGGDYQWGDIALDGETILAQKLPWATKLIGIVPGLGGWYRRRVERHHHEADLLSQKRTSADCSQAYVRALRVGAAKKITDKLDSEVTPNDIARSEEMVYIGHLGWPEGWLR